MQTTKKQINNDVRGKHKSRRETKKRTIKRKTDEEKIR